MGTLLFSSGLCLGVLLTFVWMRWTDSRAALNSLSAETTAKGAHSGLYELLLPIEDMFTIKDRGYVATGEVVGQSIAVGDQVWVSTAGKELFFTVAAIQSMSGELTRAEKGQSIGVLLKGDGGSELQRGHVLRRATE